ncbi:MAG: DinB family protein [Planctomycetota bacterium]|nr:DinB family protein [Planctomycetota bacterium]
MNEIDACAGTQILERTPIVLTEWLRGLPDEWLDCDQGTGTWSPRAVVGHLIEGERSDWMPCVHHLLLHGEALAFEPFDRFARLRDEPRSITAQLDEFARLRAVSLSDLCSLALTPEDLERRGRHPEFGAVKLGRHLATWVAHDLSHIAQIARVMARGYDAAVGPWRAYLPIIGEWKR